MDKATAIRELKKLDALDMTIKARETRVSREIAKLGQGDDGVMVNVARWRCKNNLDGNRPAFAHKPTWPASWELDSPMMRCARAIEWGTRAGQEAPSEMYQVYQDLIESGLDPDAAKWCSVDAREGLPNEVFFRNGRAYFGLNDFVATLTAKSKCIIEE